MNLFEAMQHVRLSLPPMNPHQREALLNRIRVSLFDLPDISPSSLSLVMSQIIHDA